MLLLLNTIFFSIHRLCHQISCNILFTPTGCLLQDLLIKKHIAFGEVKEGLYLLTPSVSSHSFTSNHVSFPVSVNVIPTVSLWHLRLGHLPFSAMKHLNFTKHSSDSDFICHICPQAKQTRSSFPVSTIKTKRLFDLIHVDTWGPYKHSTYNGYKYFLTIVDDYSRGTWTFLLSTKSNAFPTLKSFFAMVERQFNTKVKCIRSDNALELGKGTCEAVYLQNHGIIHQQSCVSTPQQNGVVERKHRHLLEIARGLYFQSKVPITYWGECVLTATHLINILPSKVLNGKTPYELFFQSAPS